MDQSKKKFSKSVQNFNNSAHNDDFNDQSEYNRRALSNLSANEKNRKKNSKNNTEPNIVANLDLDTQKTLLKTFEMFYEQESEIMIAALEESREEIKNSMMELFYEQEHYKDELVKASEGKYTFKRKKENSIPLSEYLRKKRGLGSRNSETDTPNEAGMQHPSDKLAVEKYLRMKERQKQAEANRLNREMTEQLIEVETQRILNKLNGIDLSKEKERDRQMEKIQAKLKGKPQQRDDQEIATEIIENYHDSKRAYERDKRLQQEKFQARLSAAREKTDLTLNGRDKNSQNLTRNNIPLVDI